MVDRYRVRLEHEVEIGCGVCEGEEYDWNVGFEYGIEVFWLVRDQLCDEVGAEWLIGSFANRCDCLANVTFG